MAWDRSPPAVDQQLEAFIEQRPDLDQRQVCDLRGGDLDRQRHAIESCTNVLDEYLIVLTVEMNPGHGGAINEEV